MAGIQTVEDAANWYERYQKEKEEKWVKVRDKKLKILDALADKGVAKVVVDYNGSGDDGDIEGVIATDINGNEVDIGSGRWHEGTLDTFHPEDLHGEIYRFCYEVLEHKYGGWEINEGSFGSFTLHPMRRTIDLAHNTRVESSELEESRV